MKTLLPVIKFHRSSNTIEFQFLIKIYHIVSSEHHFISGYYMSVKYGLQVSHEYQENLCTTQSQYNRIEK